MVPLSGTPIQEEEGQLSLIRSDASSQLLVKIIIKYSLLVKRIIKKLHLPNVLITKKDISQDVSSFFSSRWTRIKL